MIEPVKCVLAVKQSSLAALRDLIISDSLTTKQQRIVTELTHLHAALKQNGDFFKIASNGGVVYLIFSGLIDKAGLEFVATEYVTHLRVLYIGNIFGLPVGTYPVTDTTGAVIGYAGTPEWVPNGPNAQFAWLAAVLLRAQINEPATPPWHFALLCGGWPGLNQPGWEYFIGPLTPWV